MIDRYPPQNIKISTAYQEEELIQIWLQNERPPVYESTVFQIRDPVLQISNKKKEKKPKEEKRRFHGYDHEV
jgi:hypothetical protein